MREFLIATAILDRVLRHAVTESISRVKEFLGEVESDQ